MLDSNIAYLRCPEVILSINKYVNVAIRYPFRV